MTKKKSLYTVLESTMIAFDDCGNEFHGYDLISKVRNITGRRYLMDSTIMRRLRECRSNNPVKYGYIVIDNEESLYRKCELVN